MPLKSEAFKFMNDKYHKKSSYVIGFPTVTLSPSNYGEPLDLHVSFHILRVVLKLALPARQACFSKGFKDR